MSVIWARACISIFLETYSAENDELYDVFGYLMAGVHEVEPPDEVDYDRERFYFKGDPKKLEQMSEIFIRDLSEYAKSNNAPLAGDTGSVILYDI